MTLIRYISKWADIPEGGVLVEADTEREISAKYVPSEVPYKRGYVQIYDHNGFELLRDYSDFIPRGIKVKMWVER